MSGSSPFTATHASADSRFDVLAVAYWDDPPEDEPRMAALRAAADRLAPFGSGVYLRNLGDEGEARVRDAFRGRLGRRAGIAPSSASTSPVT